MKTSESPFALTYSPNIPEILYKLNFTLVISTFQAGKVIFLSAVDSEKLVQLPRTFSNAMGIAISGPKIAIACKSDLIVLKNFPQLAKNYPAQPATYDALYIPKCKYYTGALDLHDMNYIGNRLIAVNTLFSCLAEINEEFSFQPIWQPPFISRLAPEDRCHLNGMVVKDNQVLYVTALGKTDTKQGWRGDKLHGGLIIHVPSGEIVMNGLSMPHSPRIYKDKLFFLNSAMGELRICDPEKSTSEVIVNLGGFARGMTLVDDYLFIGMSKLRHTTDVFSTLPIAKTSFAGIQVVDLKVGKVTGQIRYETSVEEIYDVKALKGMRRPGILNEEKEDAKNAITLPDTSYWAVPEKDK
jgi:uncharacterized protein (TIGR03032 family)